MKKTVFIMAAAGLFICSSICAQKTKSNYYFVTKSDTTFCKQLDFITTAQGYLSSLKYIDMQGKKVEIEGRKNVPDVLTFQIDSVTIDKTPLKAEKPDGYIRYTERAVDGKLKVYLAQQGYISGGMVYDPNSAFSHDGWRSASGPSGIYRFYLKMPDGTYYKINSGANMKNHIKPYLLQCKEFEKQYKGDFSTREEPFMEMISLYNSLCK